MKRAPAILTVLAIASAIYLAAMPPAPVNPAPLHLIWEPGDYSNFVIVTTADLTMPVSQWLTFTQTTETNLEIYPIVPEEYFALYGTNADGWSAWCGAECSMLNTNLSQSP